MWYFLPGRWHHDKRNLPIILRDEMYKRWRTADETMPKTHLRYNVCHSCFELHEGVNPVAKPRFASARPRTLPFLRFIMIFDAGFGPGRATRCVGGSLIMLLIYSVLSLQIQSGSSVEQESPNQSSVTPTWLSSLSDPFGVLGNTIARTWNRGIHAPQLICQWKLKIGCTS